MRFHRAMTTLREQAENDPWFFPSPVGERLPRDLPPGSAPARDSAALGHSVIAPIRAIVLPTLKTALKNPDGLTIGPIARQRGTVSFEKWANRFRAAVTRQLDGWYRPLVGAVYRLSRLPQDDRIPAEVTQLGQMFAEARTHWQARSSPLTLLVERLVAVVRNSEAHNHTTLDLASERFLFINRDTAGIEKKDRWNASAAELERLAIHVNHLGDVMQTFLLTVPFRFLDPDFLFAMMADLFSPTPHTPTQPAG